MVALGGDLHPESLLLAYRNGIFPWPVEGYPLAWFSPGKRGILEFSRLHVPRRLARTRRGSGLRFTVDAAFGQVIRHCATVPRSRPTTLGLGAADEALADKHAESIPAETDDEDSVTSDGTAGETASPTWITPGIVEAYEAFHECGFAHSVEAWNGDRLVGGLYGVCIDGFFAGESMFHLEPNASKLALLELVDRLSAAGATWMDIQMVTPHMEALGAREITRNAFLKKLAETRELGLDLATAFR